MADERATDTRLRELLTEFVQCERALIDARSLGGQHTGHSASISPSVCKNLEAMLVRAASSVPATPEQVTNELGLNIDMLDADRLRQWADNFETYGVDLSDWADLAFVIKTLRDLANRLAQEVRDVGALRAVARQNVFDPPVVSPTPPPTRYYGGPIEVGMHFLWEKDNPRAWAHVVVTRVEIKDANGVRFDERRIWTRVIASTGVNTIGSETWNEEGRCREAFTHCDEHGNVPVSCSPTPPGAQP